MEGNAAMKISRFGRPDPEGINLIRVTQAMNVAARVLEEGDDWKHHERYRLIGLTDEEAAFLDALCRLVDAKIEFELNYRNREE